MYKKVIASLLVGVCIGSAVTYQITNEKHKKDMEVIMRRERRAITTRNTVSRSNTKLVRKLSNANKDLSEVNKELNKAYSKIEELQCDLKALSTFSSKYKMGRFEVTAYSPYDNVSGMENNGNPNVTSTGAKPTNGTIAVDPKVIPYGSKIIIIYEDGTVEKGRAEDCGGAIKGNIIDVFRWTYKDAINHGRREAMVIWYNE